MKVTKQELIETVAEKTGATKKDAKALVEALFETIAEALAQGKKVQITGFGTFEVRERKARTGVKPGTGEKIPIPASKYPTFKPGRALKERVK